MNLLHPIIFFLFSLFSASFSQDVTASPAIIYSGPSAPSLSTAPFSTATGSGNSSSPAASSTNTGPTTFANFTTTNAQGSTIVTSIPITISPSMTPTTTSSAPFPSLTGYPTCVTNCLTDAVAQVNCSSITAVACYCTNATFPTTLYNCVAANCSANVPSAEKLAQQFCALDSVTLSFASTAAPSTSLPSSAGSTSSSSSRPSNAASTAPWMSDTRGWTGMALAACGAMFGATLL